MLKGEWEIKFNSNKKKLNERKPMWVCVCVFWWFYWSNGMEKKVYRYIHSGETRKKEKSSHLVHDTRNAATMRRMISKIDWLQDCIASKFCLRISTCLFNTDSFFPSSPYSSSSSLHKIKMCQFANVLWKCKRWLKSTQKR